MNVGIWGWGGCLRLLQATEPFHQTHTHNSASAAATHRIEREFCANAVNFPLTYGTVVVAHQYQHTIQIRVVYYANAFVSHKIESKSCWILLRRGEACLHSSSWLGSTPRNEPGNVLPSIAYATSVPTGPWYCTDSQNVSKERTERESPKKETE